MTLATLILVILAPLGFGLWALHSINVEVRKYERRR